ncbi:MAG: DUF4007 family protein [Candidatus Accumulibacter sp.]|nr:DUF4007 family protein [Candidatus Accumulibacter conexus]
MTPFTANRVAFGRHETFHLRFGWLTKGYRNWCETPELFGEDDPTVVLGVGKNMVTAIRYWMEAAQVVQSAPTRGVAPTKIGRLLFAQDSGWDPYLEDDASLWLLHWLIASNPRDATAIYWYFNRYHKPEFTSGELFDALSDFVRANAKSKAADTTLKRDINVLLRMYGPHEATKGAPLEDGLDSPMAMLGLIQRSSDGKHYLSRVTERRRLPVAALGYAVLDLMEALQDNSVPLERLMRADPQYAAPGAVFRITEDGLITKLEELIRCLPGSLELRETAGIHQLYRLQSCDKHELLAQHYAGTRLESAA